MLLLRNVINFKQTIKPGIISILVLNYIGAILSMTEGNIT